MANKKKEEKVLNSDEVNNDFIKNYIKNTNREAGGQIMFLLEDGSPAEVSQWVSFGSTVLDYIASNRRNGGAAAGKILDISGAESTGKSLLAQSLCKSTQQLGGLCLYMDFENAFQNEFAKIIGLDVNKNFIYSQPTSLEEGFDSIFGLIKTLDEAEKIGQQPFPVVTIVFDSVAGAPCLLDITTENTDATSSIAMKPRVLSKNITTLLKATGRKKVLLVFLNQLRANIGASYGADKWITPGGKSIPFASSLRLRVSTLSKLKVKDEIVGIRASVEVRKNRFGPGFRKAEFDIYYDRGIDDAGSILDVLSDSKGIVKSSGGTKGSLYHFKGDDKETAINKKEWMKKFKTDEEFKTRVLDLLEIAMVKKPTLTEDLDIDTEAGSDED